MIACDIRLNTALSDEDRHQFQNHFEIQTLLGQAKTIAIVGLSTEPTKASNMVGSYLKDEGFTVVPIHPKAKEVLGFPAYPRLQDVPFAIDIVNVFRPTNEVAGIVSDAIEIGAGAIWMQLRIIDLESARIAKQTGMTVVVDRCIKMEHGRYSGRLHWAGMNTEVISARRRVSAQS
jgi:predicted CoA-binding protein